MRAIALWAAPRSRSTAFFRSMLAHGELTALHEPFGNIADFGETEVEGRTVRSAEDLLKAVKDLSQRQSVFFKDTTDHRHPEVLADQEFLAGATHTFLIRRPEEIAASYFALKPEMTASDIGLEGMHELYQAVLAAGGEKPVVIDSDDLVGNPEATMAAYCGAVGVPFRQEALSWNPSTRDEWQRTDRWHTAVSNSSGISKTSTSYRYTVENHPLLAEFSDSQRQFYELLYAARLSCSA